MNTRSKTQLDAGKDTQMSLTWRWMQDSDSTTLVRTSQFITCKHCNHTHYDRTQEFCSSCNKKLSNRPTILKYL